MPVKKCKPLTPDEAEAAKALKRARVPEREIMRRLGTTRHHLMRVLSPRDYQRKLERERYYFAGWKTQDYIGAQTIRVVPASVLEERDRALSIVETPNMALLGDPPPCRSALYRRGGGNAPSR